MTDQIMPGCEPFSSPGSSMGVLVLHGFTGNPYSMRPLAERCAKAGYSVELPRLPGHGTSLEDLVPRRWSDFVKVALGAYAVSYTHLRAHETGRNLVCRL